MRNPTIGHKVILVRGSLPQDLIFVDDFGLGFCFGEGYLYGFGYGYSYNNGDGSGYGDGYGSGYGDGSGFGKSSDVEES